MKKLLKSLKSKFLLKFYGFTQNNKLLNSDCYINGLCKFNGKEVFGENVNFNGCKIYGQGEVIFGDNFHSGKKLIILTSNHDYQGDSIPYNKNLIHKNVIIEDNVWIGMNVIILGGVTLGEGCIIQAGSVVSSSVPELAIVGGNPARKFKERDKNHYKELKDNKSFF